MVHYALMYGTLYYDNIAVMCQKRPGMCQNRPSMCQKRPSMCQKRPSMCQKRPIMCQKRPSMCQKRPIMCQKRPSMCQKRPSMCQKRPPVQGRSSTLAHHRRSLGPAFWAAASAPPAAENPRGNRCERWAQFPPLFWPRGWGVRCGSPPWQRPLSWRDSPLWHI